MEKDMEKISAAEIYEKVYAGQICDCEKKHQMDTVLLYFMERGFNIRRVLNPRTNSKTFYWYLTWE